MLPAVVSIQQAPLVIVCQNSSVTLNVNGSPGEALWNTGINSASLSITSGTATSYSVVAQVGCAVGSATIAVSNLSLVASALTPSICPGEPASFGALGNAFGYTWTPGNTTGTLVTLYPNVDSVTLTVNGSGGCVTTKTVAISILPQPTLTLAGSSTICAGATLSQTVTGANTYQWNTGATGDVFTDTPLGYTQYTVTGTSLNTCTNTAVAYVFVKTSPTITSVSTQTAICIGSTVNITGLGAVSYSWNGIPSNALNSVSPLVTTVYTITGASSNSCTASKTIEIIVYELPSLTVTPASAVFCKGEKIKLTADGASTYTWVSQPSLSSTITVSPSTNTTYTVVGTNTSGCSSEISYALVVSPCTGIETNARNSVSFKLYPNPNNGQFSIETDKALSFSLFNELGQVVKEFSLTGSSVYELSVNDLPGGIYFVIGQQDQTIFKEKIVIQK